MNEPVASLDLTNLIQDLTTISTLPPEKIAENVLTGLGTEIETTAKALAPHKTGALRDSIVAKYDNGSLTIDAGVAYGMFQEFGTGTRGEYPKGMYQIRPKNGKFLRFTVGKKTVFAKVVNHPGIPAHPYLRPATQIAVNNLGSKLSEQGALMIRKGPASAL